MIKPPYTKWINDIKTKLGFNRTMTASGADVVDAVNKQSQQIANLLIADYDSSDGSIVFRSSDVAQFDSSDGSIIINV